MMTRSMKLGLGFAVVLAATALLGVSAAVAGQAAAGADEKADNAQAQPLAGPKVDTAKNEGNKGGKRMMRPAMQRRFSGQRRRGAVTDAAGLGDQRVLRQVLAKLNLSEEQKNKIHADAKGFMEEMRGWREKNQEELKALRAEVQEARKGQDRQKLRELGQQMRKLRADAPKPKDLLAKIKKSLTAEQSKQFEELMKKEMQQAMQDRPMMRRGQQREGKGKKGRKEKPAGESGKQLDL